MATCVQCGRSLERGAADCAWCDDSPGRERANALPQPMAGEAAHARVRNRPAAGAAAFGRVAGSPAGPRPAATAAGQRGLVTADSAEFEPRRTSSWPPRPLDASQRATPTGLQLARPPVLASDVLRSDLSPAAPAVQRVRASLAALGLVGFAAAMVLVGPLAFGAVIGGAFAALAALGMVRMAYQTRAAATVAISGAGLAVTIWNRLQHGAELDAVVLLMGVTLLGTALVFRGWHRGSALARLLVAIGIVVCATWLVTSGEVKQLVAPPDAWQVWLGPVLALTLLAVLLLSLLAFMDARSTGACGVWAGLLLGWYTVYTWTALLTLYWPPLDSGSVVQPVTGEFGLTVLATPIFVCVLTLGLSQLLAVAGAADSQPDPQRPR